MAQKTLQYTNVYKSKTETKCWEDNNNEPLEAMSYFFHKVIKRKDEKGNSSLSLKVDYEQYDAETDAISFLYVNVNFADSLLKYFLSESRTFRQTVSRFGKEVMILSKSYGRKIVGLLSFVFLYNIKSKVVLIPVLSWKESLKKEIENKTLSAESLESLEIIKTFTKYKDIESIEALFAGKNEEERVVRSWGKIIVHRPRTKIIEFDNDDGDFIQANHSSTAVIYHPLGHVNSLSSYLSCFFFKNPFKHITVRLKSVEYCFRELEDTFQYETEPENKRKMKLDVKFGKRHTLKKLECDILFGFIENELCYIQPLENTETRNWISINCRSSKQCDKKLFMEYLTKQQLSMKLVRRKAQQLSTITTSSSSNIDDVEVVVIDSDNDEENNTNEMGINTEYGNNTNEMEINSQYGKGDDDDENNEMEIDREYEKAIFHDEVMAITDIEKREYLLRVRDEQLTKLRLNVVKLFTIVTPENKDGIKLLEKGKIDKFLETLANIHVS